MKYSSFGLCYNNLYIDVMINISIMPKLYFDLFVNKIEIKQ